MTRRFVPTREWEDARQIRGLEGEHAAMAYLTSCGWSIEAHRFRLGRHDLDLIARRGRVGRSGPHHDGPAENDGPRWTSRRRSGMPSPRARLRVRGAGGRLPIPGLERSGASSWAKLRHGSTLPSSICRRRESIERGGATYSLAGSAEIEWRIERWTTSSSR